MWLIRKLGWPQTIVFTLIAFIAGWSFWLPYFVPIVEVESKALVREGNDLVVEVVSYKRLPCVYLSGRAFMQADKVVDEPVHPTNYFTGASLNQGLMWAGLPDDTTRGLPLWYPFETKLRIPLSERLRREPLSTLRLVLILEYHCNVITSPVQRIISIPAK